MSEPDDDRAEDLDPWPDILGALIELVEWGPRRVSEVVGRLLSDGYFDELIGAIERKEPGVEVHRDDLARTLLDEVVHDDRVWSTGHEDPWLASIDVLMVDAVFTHRLTAEEIERQEVHVVPDLVVLDCGADSALRVPGGTLRYVPGSGGRRPGHDDSVLTGPDGWLAGFSPGDLVAFGRQDDWVTVASAGELAPDDHIVSQLTAAARRNVRPGRGEEAFPVVLDAMAADTEAFRRPARPLGELMEAAGLERRGFSWGWQGTDWLDAAERARLFRRSLAAREYGFDTCCEAAYDRVLEAVSAPGGPGDRRLVRALAHGAVAPAAAREVLDHPDGDGERAARLEAMAGEMVDSATGPERASALLVLGLAAGRRREAPAAEAHLRRALEEDPDYRPAARELVRYAIDRGDLAVAVNLLDRAGGPFPGYIAESVRRIHDRLTSPYRHVGRNEPCPCGTGRKYKACCLRAPRIPARLRGALLDVKLAAFLHAGHGDRFFALASREVDPTAGAVDPLAFNRVATDLDAFEGGLAEAYLDGHGALLPDEERGLLRAAIDEPRRLWEVVGAGRGDQIALRDTETARTAAVERPPGVMPAASAGSLLLWRIVRVGTTDVPVGFVAGVGPHERERARKVLASRPDTLGLLAWYRRGDDG